MAKKRLIPAMLLSGSRLVKGRGFTDHEDAGNPVTTAKIYNDQMADEIVVIDIEATSAGRDPDFATLAALTARCFVPITFGGGIATLDAATKALRAGADKVLLNAAALAQPALIGELAGQFGRQAVMVAIDTLTTKSGPRVARNCGRQATDIAPLDWALEAQRLGAGEILLTSVEREGMRGGLDLGTVGDISGALSIPVIAHGGVGRLEDFVTVFQETAAAAVAAGRIFQFADNNLIKVRRFMQQHGIDLRTH